MIVLLVALISIYEIGADIILSFFGDDYSSNGGFLLRTLAISVIPWSFFYLYISLERIKKHIKKYYYFFTVLY